MHQNDGLKGGSSFVGQLMESLLFAPALLQEGFADHAGWAFEAGAEVEGDVRARLGAAATRQVDLKPAKTVHTRAELSKWETDLGPQSPKVPGLLCIIRAL